ncbi:hypothetical protein GCWU000324_00844 [Kingella oralis ATCC 51147]|uniref:Uncharacterized protein n=1 Tax=Kingella oralis ATCC 51147 TaxID=629741 RepID=C4GFC3_9NEIS|nr:hypothetical protein GCWU000324_00844 [Kingella oralis ATCC 51147]
MIIGGRWWGDKGSLKRLKQLFRLPYWFTKDCLENGSQKTSA